MLMVSLSLGLAKFPESTCPNFNDGFNLTMVQFAKVGIMALHSLEIMSKTKVKMMLSHMPESIMVVAHKKWLVSWGWTWDGLTPTIIKNVLESARKAKAIHEKLFEKFCKVVLTPCDSTIINFME